jgi:hypothetical protein
MLALDQSIIFLDGCHVHVPLKGATYAVDPLQRLGMRRFGMG